MSLRIGITMREVNAEGYDEPRDALAQDWYAFMDKVFPKDVYFLIPNIGDDVKKYIKRFNLNAFIFSGGNDIGSSEKRDLTEKNILDYAIEQNKPVFGVCRGLQFFNHYCGGKLVQCDASVHVAEEHKVLFGEGLNHILQEKEGSVNSFHNQGVKIENLPDELECLATSEDGFVEALRFKKHPIIGVMWHPERGTPVRNVDCNLINYCFGDLI